jgi:hypothetical protein
MSTIFRKRQVMKHKNIALFLWIAIVFVGCSNNRQTRQNSSIDRGTVDDYVYAINNEQNTHPDSITVMRTFQKIQSVPDKFIIADSTIKDKADKQIFTFKLFYPFNKISKNNDTLKCTFVLIPEINHSTPKELKEIVLKSIAKKNGFYEINLYSSMTSFYEQIENDAPSTATEMNKKIKIEWDGFTGHLHQGKYYEYELNYAR